jgi:hypothetical protein
VYKYYDIDKNPSGKIYVCRNISVYDKEAKMVKHIRRIIRHLDPVTSELISNRRKGNIARKKAEMEKPAIRLNFVRTSNQW